MRRSFLLPAASIALLIWGAGQAQVWQEWVAFYDGPRHDRDCAVDMAVDSEGNPVVTGYSYVGPGWNYSWATLKYNSDGVQQWVAFFRSCDWGNDVPVALALDADRNIYITGISDTGFDEMYATVKYNMNGDTLWVAYYSYFYGDFELERPAAICVDEYGNSYVTGKSDGGPSTDTDYATIKYDPNGARLWSARYHGYLNYPDDATAIAVDAEGNVYVTGCSQGLESGWDYATIKYNSQGIQEWVVRYDGPAHSYDVPTSMALDQYGNIYVTGASISLSPYADYTTIKYNPSGVQEWIARYDSNEDYAQKILVAGAEAIYVTGYSSASATSFDAVTVKYDSLGQELWVARLASPGSEWDRATELALDLIGNIYVAGRWQIDGDYFTAKYDPSGVEQWVMIYNGPNNGGDAANALAVDYYDNVFVTGGVDWSWSTGNYATIKYSQIGPPTPVVLSAFSALPLETGISLLWRTASEINSYGWVVQRSSAEMEFRDISPLIPGHGSSSEPHEYSYLDDSALPGQTYSYRLKMIDTGGSITYSSSIVTELQPMAFHLSVSPNPFNGVTRIHLVLPQAAIAELLVTDTLGRPVGAGWTLPLPAGNHDIPFDGSDLPSGIYLYRLKAGSHSAAGKVLLLR